MAGRSVRNTGGRRRHLFVDCSGHNLDIVFCVGFDRLDQLEPLARVVLVLQPRSAEAIRTIQEETYGDKVV